jgi:hypothetical protein
MHSWPDRNPTWRYMFWSWADMQEAIHVALPQYDELVTRVGGDHQMRLDIGRYAILYLVGGGQQRRSVAPVLTRVVVSIDLDVECLRAIPDQITLEHEAIAVAQPDIVSKILYRQTSRPDGAVLGIG